MQIQFLGTGGAFDYEYGNSAAWIKIRDKQILLDCGNSIYARLRETHLAEQIDYILISHCHDDHVGSLTSLLLHQNYFATPPRKPTLLVPNPQFEQHLRSYLNYGIPNPDEYVVFAPLTDIEGLTAIDTFGEHIPGMPSFGYVFEDDRDIVIYSGDTGNPITIFNSIPANTSKRIRIFHEMAFEHTDGLHVYYQDLMPYLDQYDIYAYHLDPRDEPADNKIPLVQHYPEFMLGSGMKE
ncbi:MAG: MBL fold metallo-hydrolase [Bacteroidota bacterium]